MPLWGLFFPSDLPFHSPSCWSVAPFLGRLLVRSFVGSLDRRSVRSSVRLSVSSIPVVAAVAAVAAVVVVVFTLLINKASPSHKTCARVFSIAEFRELCVCTQTPDGVILPRSVCGGNTHTHTHTHTR